MAFKKGYNGPISVVTCNILDMEPWKENKLGKFFAHATDYVQLMDRKIREVWYTSGLNKQYRDALSRFKKGITNEERKEIYATLKNLLNEGPKACEVEIQNMRPRDEKTPLFSQFGFISVFTYFTKLSLGNITYQNLGFATKITSDLATSYYQAWEKFFNRETDKIPNRKEFCVSTLTWGSKNSSNGKFTITGLDAVNHIIAFKNICGKSLSLKYEMKEKEKMYEAHAMSVTSENGTTPFDVVQRFNIARKFVRGKYHYYVQLLVRNSPYNKHELGKGCVGIDPSTSGIIHYAENGKMDPFFFTTENMDMKKYQEKYARINRYLDRSRRANNPDNYNEDGTVKKGRKTWVKSKNYIKAQNELRELNRVITAKKLEIQNAWANSMLKEGDVFNVEDTSFKALAKRSNETKFNKNGRQKTKKRYGKSIGSNAPAKAIALLERKVNNIGGTFNRVPAKLGATGHDHVSGEYTKHEVNERFVTISDGTVLQRDIHSAANLAFAKKVNGEWEFDDKRTAQEMPKVVQLQENVFATETGRKPWIIGTKEEYEKKKNKNLAV